MNAPTFTKLALAIIVIVAIAVAAYSYRDVLLSHSQPPSASSAASIAPAPTTTAAKIIVSEPAQKNLGIIAKPMQVESYWKTISVPGIVVDRPGVSDRDVVAPAVGTISQILCAGRYGMTRRYAIHAQAIECVCAASGS